MKSLLPRRSLSLVLLGSISLASLAAACGGGQTNLPATDPSNPLVSGSASAAASHVPPASSSAAIAVPSASAGPSAPLPGAAPEHPMGAPTATKLAADLQALGLDAKNLPKLDKLTPKQTRDVMKLFTKSLGAKCSDCHAEGDFGAPTRRKKITTKMWDEFTRGLAMHDGAPLFCDSCHQGHIVGLDRRDKKVLAKWMDEQLVDALKQKSGGEHGCEASQCHGKSMEMRFVAKWGG